jgi:hypothetical protein
MGDMTEFPSDEEVRSVFDESATIAVVGLSSNPYRPSHGVARFLQGRGYRIIPVNPNERVVLGEKAYGSLSDVPDPIDVVDVFRRAEETPDVARQAVVIGAKILWLQEGVVNEEAKRIGEEGGLKVFMDMCMSKEARRLGIERRLE